MPKERVPPIRLEEHIPGQKLYATHKGHRYVGTVVADSKTEKRFLLFRHRLYTLSGAAQAITGTSMRGPTFWSPVLRTRRRKRSSTRQTSGRAVRRLAAGGARVP